MFFSNSIEAAKAVKLIFNSENEMTRSLFFQSLKALKIIN